MRRARLGLISGAVIAVAVVAACGLDESGAPGDSGALPDVGGFDGGLEAAQDVAYDVPDLGVGETEAGLPCTCVTSVPAGYHVVELDPTQQGACTPGYGSAKNWFEVLAAPPAQCACSCAPQPTVPPRCTCGTDPVTFPISGGRSDCTDYTNQSLQANAGSCYTSPQTLPVTGNGGDYLLVGSPGACAPSGGSCGGGLAKQTIPDASVAQGSSCDQTAANGTCNGGVCLPTPGSGYELCITNHTATTSCAAFTDFPEAHLVGDGVADSRGCAGACDCDVTDAGSCGSPVLELWSSSGSCSGAPDVVLDASCSNVNQGNDPRFNSAHYDVPHSGGACGVTGNYNPTGGAVVTNRFVICCRP